jgi:hypothetical protein
VWLSRPEIIGLDGGSEFKHVFEEEMHKNYGMKSEFQFQPLMIHTPTMA